MTSRNRAARRRTQGASTAIPHDRFHAPYSLAKDFCSSHASALRLAGLAGILLLSFWSGMSHHWDYRFPLHVDEWFAIGFAQTTIDSGALEYPNPYRQVATSFHPEMGFHLVLGFIKTTTGLAWLDLYRIAPGVLMAGLAFLTYSFGRRAGFGWAAAIFVSLIPTSVRILGPAFVVPVTGAMLFMPVTLLVLHDMGAENRQKSLWTLTLLISGAIFFHPPTGAAITALVGLYMVGFLGEALALKRYRDGASLLLSGLIQMSIPALILGLWLPSLSRTALSELDAGSADSVDLLGLLSGFTGAFGIAGVIVFAIGVFVFIARGEFGVRGYMLPMFAGLLLAFLVLIFPEFGIGPDVVYRRSWLYLGLLMAIFAGYGVSFYFRSIPAMAEMAASRFRRLAGTGLLVALWAIGIAALVAVVFTGLIGNEDREEYSVVYHVVNERISTDFRWIAQHAAAERTVAVGEPTIGWAYPPVAGPGTAVFESVFAPFTTPKAEKLRQMILLREADVPWLERSGISIFYSCLPRTFACREMKNTDLFKVRRGVYVVPDLSDQN